MDIGIRKIEANYAFCRGCGFPQHKVRILSKLPTFIPKPGFNGKESDLQSLCEQYLEARNLLYLHIPAHLLEALFASPAVPVWIKKAVKRYIAHWPDLIIFRSGSYLAIELKTARGRTTRGQRERIKALEGHVVRDVDEFIRVVGNWLCEIRT